MADAGVLVGWQRSVPGKERVALELFGTFTGYLKKQQTDGRIESYEAVLLQPHGGDLNGFILIRGERSRLGDVVATEEFQTYVVRGGLALENFGVIPCDVGNGVTRQLGLYGKSI